MNYYFILKVIILQFF